MQKEIEAFFKSGIISFKTGGTTTEGQVVEKTYENMKTEANDIFEELQLGNNLEFITTTTYEHLFGFTFHRMLPALHGYKINPERINYPEDINIKNAVLITTPSFLEVMKKYGARPKVNPKIIITAGAKLENQTFLYAQTFADRVIEIYGSTETGAIAYRESYQDKFKPFRGIRILEAGENYTKISTDYSLKSPVIIEDRIIYKDGKIEFGERCGRVLKVQEKRISATSMENLILKSGFIEEAFCFEHKGKLAVLAVPNAEGKNFLIKNDKLIFVKMLKNILYKNSEIVPQLWEFAGLIPHRTNGKIDKTAVKSLFGLNLTLPLVLSRNIKPDSADFELCFLNNSNFFKGHFEGFPVLAGVVQLFYANFFAQTAFQKDFSNGQVRKLKFTNIIRPAQILNLILTQKQNGIEFKYQDENKTYSSGVLPIKNIYEDNK